MHFRGSRLSWGEAAPACTPAGMGPRRARPNGVRSGEAPEWPSEAVPMNEVTRILSAAQQGDAGAAAQLLPLVYDELRKCAAQRLAGRSPAKRFRRPPWSTKPISAWSTRPRIATGTIAATSSPPRPRRCGGSSSRTSAASSGSKRGAAARRRLDFDEGLAVEADDRVEELIEIDEMP